MSSTNLANIRHPYHLVDPSPQPFVISFALLMITTGTVFYMHGLPVYRFVLPLGIAWFIWIFVDWFRAIVQESTFMGYHTEKVQFSHRTGIKLFIASEVMFFFSFFLGFFCFKSFTLYLDFSTISSRRYRRYQPLGYTFGEHCNSTFFRSYSDLVSLRYTWW
jgi:hypothetical protein